MFLNMFCDFIKVFVVFQGSGPSCRVDPPSPPYEEGDLYETIEKRHPETRAAAMERKCGAIVVMKALLGECKVVDKGWWSERGVPPNGI